MSPLLFRVSHLRWMGSSVSFWTVVIVVSGPGSCRVVPGHRGTLHPGSVWVPKTEKEPGRTERGPGMSIDYA